MSRESNTYLVRYADLEYARSAFIDARTPGSHLKENYCIIGKGVSENPRQPIHIHQTDGFHIGAAGQPPGILNSLHSHFTAEIFMIFKGTFRIYWGPEAEGEAILGPGDIISVPTYCFRGFEVIGEKNGFLFAVLGGDDCGGGIVWHPDVIYEGRRHGLYLKKDKSLADTVAGDPVPSEDELFVPMSSQEVYRHKRPTVTEMLERVSFLHERSSQESDFTRAGSFECHHISGSPESEYNFEIKALDAVSIFAYQMDEDGFVPMHRRRENTVLVNHSGDILVTFEKDQLEPILLTPGDVFDTPKGQAYSLTCTRGPGYIYCVVGSDRPSDPELI